MCSLCLYLKTWFTASNKTAQLSFPFFPCVCRNRLRTLSLSLLPLRLASLNKSTHRYELPCRGTCPSDVFALTFLFLSSSSNLPFPRTHKRATCARYSPITDTAHHSPSRAQHSPESSVQMPIAFLSEQDDEENLISVSDFISRDGLPW